jgi:hypothetical protein
MTILVDLVNLGNDPHLCLSQISSIALGLALLEDEQKFKLRGYIGDHKMPISCGNMSNICKK